MVNPTWETSSITDNALPLFFSDKNIRLKIFFFNRKLSTKFERRNKMTRAELIEYCEELEVPFQAAELDNGYKPVYVYSRDEYDKKRKHPRLYGDLFVPYLRISHFEEEGE